MRYSLGKSNLEDVVRTYNFVSSLGVSKFKFRVLFPDGRAKKRLVHELISGVNMAGAQCNLIKASIGNKTTVEVTQPCFFHLPGRVSLSSNGYPYNAFKESCPCGTIAAYIDSNGDVKYCLFDENILGNVCTDPFLTVWNSQLAEDASKYRCPLDKSGNDCSSFKILYSRYGDYDAFMKNYIRTAREKRL